MTETVDSLVSTERATLNFLQKLPLHQPAQTPFNWTGRVQRVSANSKRNLRQLLRFAGAFGERSKYPRATEEEIVASNGAEQRHSEILGDALHALSFAPLRYGELCGLLAAWRMLDKKWLSFVQQALVSSTESISALSIIRLEIWTLETKRDLEKIRKVMISRGVAEAGDFADWELVEEV